MDPTCHIYHIYISKSIGKDSARVIVKGNKWGLEINYGVTNHISDS